MNRHLYKLLILISLNSFSQVFNSQISDGSFLFTFKDKSYLISEDSIYSNPNALKWIAKKHNLLINEFAFITDGDQGYLMHNSGGVLYEFDGTNFKRLDESFEFNTQYQSFPFLYNGSVYNFGGYGLFTFKNILTYFNKSKKETELVGITSAISKSPSGRKKMLGQISEGVLFIGSGYGLDNDKENASQKGIILDDYWTFDFKTKKWSLLGRRPFLTEDENYTIIYDFNGKNLLIADDKVCSIDIKTNQIVFYDNVNSDFIKSLKKDATHKYITFNKAEGGFYLILDKPNLGSKLLFITSDEFLGKPTRTERLYVVNDDSIFYYLAGGLFLLIFIYFITKKENTLKKINSKRNEIDLILNEEENQIFNLIYNKYPDFISFPELMDVFEPHVSYESRKKKLRASLYQIEDKIKVVLKTKKSIFIEQKNKEDLRIKEIRIQS